MNEDVKKLIEARDLLIQCLPYVENHYKMSRTGTGMGALKLMKAIEEFLMTIGWKDQD